MKRIKDLTVFIVDDNPLTRASFQQCLTRLGCEKVHSFDNGQGCLDDLPLAPDLVLVDYLMEPMNGLELMKKIKRVLPQCFVVMISAQSDLQVAVNAMKYGAFDYISKGKTEMDQIAGVLHKMLYSMNLVKRGRPRTVNPQKIFPILPAVPPALR
jgi:DNA-binding NtrC family response regulator